MSTRPTTSRHSRPRSPRSTAAPRTRAGCCARCCAAPADVGGRTLSARALAGLGAIRPGDDIAALIAEASPAAGDVVVIAHKIVSKAEGRIRPLAEIEPGERA